MIEPVHPNANYKEIKSIQILRAIAALSVVYYHSTHKDIGMLSLPIAGSFGVDIFFVISGFVIALMLLRNTNNFFIKRLFRIMPIYIIATIIMVMGHAFLPQGNTTIVNSLTFIKSIFFIPYSHNPILMQGWTLNYEMFFYLVTSFCLLIVKNKKLVAVACALVLSVMFITLKLSNTKIFVLRYYKADLFFEFIYGIILFYIYNHCVIKRKKYFLIKNKQLNIVVFILLGLLSFAFLVIDEIYQFRISAYRGIEMGIPALLLVFSFLNLENIIPENAFITFWIKLGDASYVMYLFHVFIVIFFTKILFKKQIANNSSVFISIILAIIILFSTIVVSIIIYKIIDKPIQKYLKRVLLINFFRSPSNHVEL